MRWLAVALLTGFVSGICACSGDPAASGLDASSIVGPILCDPIPCPGALICVRGLCEAAPDAASADAATFPDATSSRADDAGTSPVDDAAASPADDAAARPADDAAARPADDAAAGPADDAAVAPADDASIVGPNADATVAPNADAAITLQPDATAGSPDASARDAGPGGATDAGNLCRSGSDCIAGAEICGRVTVENNVVVTRCGPPNTSGPARPVGGQCVADSECSSNLCLDGLSNECSQVCRDPATDCPGNFACVGYTYNPGNVTVPVCNRRCADDDDCPTSGTACSVATYRDASSTWQLSTVCQVASGSVPLGGACTTPNDCRSGICFNTRRIGVGCAACTGGEMCVGADCVVQACTAICDDPSDCAAGGPLTRCAPGVNFTLPDNTTRSVSACSRP